MPTDTKELIRERIDIVDVVEEVVALKPAGRDQFKGLCPFHSEKTPSFHVHRERGFYYCFGCQAKGDVFDFVMQTQSVEFYEALQLLGRQVGVEVAPPTPGSKKRRDLYEVNDAALAFFRSQLDGPARAYLERRKLTPESIERFALGFAPDAWDGLLRHATTKGISSDDLLEAGLIVENERGRRYDRFRNRVMFPIRDYLGRVVGFSGRVLDDSVPKYLNTPETELFDKKTLLYGLDRAKSAIRESGACIVVEGYMDVIALHQVGIENAVAALGATMTAEQAQQLSRLDVERLYLAFDADEAGHRAVLSGLEQSVGRRFLVRAVTVPHGKDPADAVLEGDVEAFRTALEQGQSEVAFRFRTVLERHDAGTTEGKRQILNELLPALRPRDVFDPVAAEMRRLVIDELGIDGARIDAWVKSQRPRRLDDTQVQGMETRRAKPTQVAMIELEVIALLLSEPRRLRERVARIAAALPPDAEDSLLLEFRDVCEACGYDDGSILTAFREREHAGVVFERLLGRDPRDEDARIDVDGQIEKDLSRLRDLYLSVEKEDRRARLLERIQEVSAALNDPDLPPDRLHQLYDELRTLNETYKAREAERRLRMAPPLVGAARGRSS